MPTNYTGVASAISNRNAPTITEPAGGDAPNAASVNNPLSALADLFASLLAHGGLLDVPGTWSAAQTFSVATGGSVLSVNNTQGTGGAAIYASVPGDPVALTSAIHGHCNSGIGYGVQGSANGSGASIIGDSSTVGATGPAGRFVRSSARGAIALDPVAGDPSAPQNGDIWYNSTTNTFRCYVGGALKTITVA